VFPWWPRAPPWPSPASCARPLQLRQHLAGVAARRRLGGDGGGGGILDITRRTRRSRSRPAPRCPPCASRSPPTARRSRRRSPRTRDHRHVSPTDSHSTGGAAGVANVKAAALGQTVSTTVDRHPRHGAERRELWPRSGPGAGGWNGVGRRRRGAAGQRPGQDHARAARPRPTPRSACSIRTTRRCGRWGSSRRSCSGKAAPPCSTRPAACSSTFRHGLQLTRATSGVRRRSRPARPSSATRSRRPPGTRRRSRRRRNAQGRADAGSGTSAYGPMTETWKISAAPLKGVVYYQSYGTTSPRITRGPAGADPPLRRRDAGHQTRSVRPHAGGGQGRGHHRCQVCTASPPTAAA